ncbi:MAG TPA: hypothetical protein PK443_04625, partial [bacterium]|nr:hypothetical protein [bacterium]
MAAAVATLKASKKEGAVDRSKSVGHKIREGLLDLINLHNLGEYVSIKGHLNWQLMLFKDENKINYGNKKNTTY